MTTQIDGADAPRFTYRQLANGEIERVPLEDGMTQDEMWEAQRLQHEKSMMNTGVAGANRCTYCGQVFNTAGILDDHQKMFHMVAAGKIDMRSIEMPDGTSVPAHAVPELIDGKAVLLEEAAKTVDILRRQLAESQEAEKALQADLDRANAENEYEFGPTEVKDGTSD